MAEYTMCSRCEEKPAAICISCIDLLKQPNLAEVKHPIGSDNKVNHKRSYCYACGTTVKNQKYCHGCGRKLQWPACPECQPTQQECDAAMVEGFEQQPIEGEFMKEKIEVRIFEGRHWVCANDWNKLRACLDSAEARLKELLEALKKYGQHSQECHDERYPEKWHCICGYDAALAKAKKVME